MHSTAALGSAQSERVAPPGTSSVANGEKWVIIEFEL